MAGWLNGSFGAVQNQTGLWRNSPPASFFKEEKKPHSGEAALALDPVLFFMNGAMLPTALGNEQ